MGPYDDIINLPHHISQAHPQMPIRDRAAQFSPFAALSGYEAKVKETARITDTKIELTEDQQAVLDECLRLLEDALPQSPVTAFTYFVPDTKKEGGTYITVTGRIRRIDSIARSIFLTDGTVIPMDDLLQVDSEAWNMLM